MSNRKSCAIKSAGGVKLDACVYPTTDSNSEHQNEGLVTVLVHLYSVLGRFQGLMKGIAASCLANRGVTVVTFNMRGVGNSAGHASLTGFAEVDDVISVCQ